MAQNRWTVTTDEQTKYIDALTADLTLLRAKAGISQAELCTMIGVSRQTYSAIESKRRTMTWTTYLSLILFYDNNVDTRELLRSLPAYPESIFVRMNEGKSLDVTMMGQDAKDLNDILKELDDQARHALKTMLLVEYARCKKIPGDVVVKAFDGAVLNASRPDQATEQALRNIKKRNHESGEE